VPVSNRFRLIVVGLLFLEMVGTDFRTAQSASISSITYLPLTVEGNFQEPPNVVQTPSIKHMAATNPVAQGARGVRGDRDLAQSFTVSEVDFPTGINVAGFAIYYEGGVTPAAGTFNVELFPVADALATPLPDSAAVSATLIVSATGLSFDTANAAGSAVFNFSSTVHLNPGGYAWRFLIPGAGTTNLFQWGPTSSTNAYATGLKYEGDADTTPQPSGAGDFYFGFIEHIVPGDFDGDNDVDGADFVAWQTNFPTPSGATLSQGDADGDGDVDGADFVVWQTNFPFTPGGGTTPVPEPSTYGLLLAALVGFVVCYQATWKRRAVVALAKNTSRLSRRGPPARRGTRG
jgi:hypothetical protein